MAAPKLHDPPPEGGNGDSKTSRVLVQLGNFFRLEIIGKALEKPGALVGVGLILASVVAVLLLLGDKLWRLFK